MKKTTLLKACAILFLFISSPDITVAQLTPVTSSGLPNVGRGQIKFSDFNNDGKLDALVIGQTTAYGTIASGGSIIGLYLGNGNGTFTDATSTWFPTTPTSVNGGMVGLADINKDGYVDFCYAGRSDAGTNVIYIYKNTGTGFSDYTATAFNGTTAPTGCYTGSIQWGDIDNDGDLDLLIQGRTYTSLNYPTSSGARGATTQLYKNNGNGVFALATVNATSVCYGQALFIDLENDGDLDIYYSGGGNIGGYMLNDGTGTFGALTSSSTTRGSNVAIGDFNKDGILDLLQSYTNTSSTPAPAFRMFYNTSTSSAISLTAAAQTVSYGVGGTAATTNTGMLSCVDYDADGDLDYTIQGLAGATTPTTSLFLNGGTTGTATFTDAAISLTGLHYGGAEWADLNNDNKPDLITFGYTDAAATTPQTIVYLNETGTANLAPSTPTTLSATPGSVATLSWTMPDNADDHTPNISLSYNVRIGTTTGASNVMEGYTYGQGKYKSTSITVKGLVDGQYYWSVQAIDGANVAGAWSTESTFTIGNPTTTPTIQATSISATSSSQTSLTLGWTNGDGYKTAIFIKRGETTADLAAPIANTTYNANANFGSGDQIGTDGWYCVYNSSVTPLAVGSVTVTGLTALTKYQVMAISYNGAADNSVINYLTSSTTGNPAILTTADYAVPAITTSALTVSTNISGTSVEITPSQAGTGYNVNYSTVVFMKAGSDATEDITLTSNTTYEGNAIFGQGSQIGTSGWYCVYNGLSSYKASGIFNPFTAFTNLQANTSYQVRACTYNGTAGLEKYSATAGITFTTPAEQITSVRTSAANSLNIYQTGTNLVIQSANLSGVTLYNTTGQIIKHTTKLSSSNSLTIVNLSNGMYIAKVQFTDGSTKAQRILFQK